jgi:protease-4
VRAAVSLLAVLFFTTTASAQLRRDSSGAWLPPTSYAASDDALSVAVNPASIAHLDTWSVHYSHADSGDGERFAERGDALYGAIPLLFGISLGAGVDSVRPSRASIMAGAIERTIVSLDVGLRLSDQLSIGAAPRVLFSGDPRLGGIFTLDLAGNWRPLPQIALSFIARDLTGPGYQGGGGAIPRSFVLAGAIRPDGTRAFTLDLAAAIDETGRVGMRAMAELEVPYFGRLLASGEFEDVGGVRPDVRVTIGAAMDWAEYGVGGGVVVGDGFESWPGWYVSARLEGERRRGLPTGDVIAEITIDGTGPRGLLRLVARLDRALRDPRVHGVLLRPRGSGIGLAYAQEIRLLVAQLEDAGKHVVCYLEDASGAELYACGGASTIVGDPAGGIRLYGPSMEIQHYAGLLRELDIRADFVRIGRFKSAIEQFHDDHMSGGAREMRETIMDDLYGRFVSDLSRDFAMEEARTIEVVESGPYVAPGAVEAGLIDQLADVHDLGDVLREVYGGDLIREHHEPSEIDRRFGRASRIGVVVIDGEMTDGENLDLPILEIHTTGGRTAVDAIDGLSRDPSISAIVIRLDTPGGSVLAADQIWRAIQRARERIPVIASMGAIAASGGYYVASGCDEIWADPATLTGSIGVWFGKMDFEPLATHFGVVTEEISRTPRANAETLWAPFTADEREVLSEAVRHWYREFLRRVAAGRGMSLTEVHALAQGRVWTGDRALDIGLVDHLGGFSSALARARQLAGLPDDAPFEVRPSRPSTLLDYVLGEVGTLGGAEASADEALSDPSAASDPTGLSNALSSLAPEVLSALRFAVLMRTAGANTPMALWPVDTRVIP